MQRRSLLHLWQIRQPFESSDVHSAKPSLAQLSLSRRWLKWWQKPNVLIRCGMNTLQWFRNQVFILSDLVTLDQLSNHEFQGTQDQKNLLARMLFTMSVEATSCRSSPRVKSCETKRSVRQLVQLTMSCQKCTKQMFTSSQIRFYVWESRRWTCQKSSSPRDGKSISSNTGNLQGWLMETRCSSYSTHLLAERRTKSCVRSMNGFDKVKENMDTVLLQKPVLIELFSWEWWPKFRFLHRDRKKVMRNFCKTRK